MDKNLEIEEEHYESGNIKIGEDSWIPQEYKLFLDDKDYFKVTETVKWKLPEGCNGETTCSFDIIIPYLFYVDGELYEGQYTLGDFSKQKDENPKYDLKVIDLTKDGFLKVKISKK